MCKDETVRHYSLLAVDEGKSKCCIVGNWTSPPIQGASSVLTNWRGVTGFKLCVGVS